MPINEEVTERIASVIRLLYAAVEDGERWSSDAHNDTHQVTWEIRCSIQTQALRDALRQLRAAVQ